MANLYPCIVTICALSLPFIGCGPPDRSDNDREPWGGIDSGHGGTSASGGITSVSAGNSTGEDTPEGEDDSSDDDSPTGGNDSGGDHGDSSGGDESPPGDGPPDSPYTGGWDIGACQDEIVPTGTDVGQVVPDFMLFDQFGDQVRLYDFCHKAVFIPAGAFW